jgi:hypothetical protein
MSQNIVLDKQGKQNFNSVMIMMKFVDEMVAKGYTKDEAIAAIEQIVKGRK